MSALPNCFTMGEATAVMHSFILFLMSAVTNLPLRYHLPPIHVNDISTVFLQVATTSKLGRHTLLLTICIISFNMLLQVGILYVIWVCVLCRYFPILRSTRYFYFMIISLLCFITLPILYVILDQNPIIWMLSFVFNTRKRVSHRNNKSRRTNYLFLIILFLIVADRRSYLLGDMSFIKRLHISVSNIIKLPSYKFDQKDFSRASHICLRTWYDIRSFAVVPCQWFDTGAVCRY